jgi:arylsulfatase A-like enzyme
VHQTPQTPFDHSPRPLIERFAVAGMFLGLLVGVYESSLVSTLPHIKALLHPDVCYVVWFLAPLVDMVIFGVVGTVLGAIAGWTQQSDAANRILLAAVGLGLAGAFAFSIFYLFYLRTKDLQLGTHLVYAIAAFIVAFEIAAVLIMPLSNRAGGFFDPLAQVRLKAVGRLLVVAAATSVAGMAFFFATRYGIVTTAKLNTSSSSRPNIILISLDTVRADHLSAYGYRRRTTPNLDRLASRGVLFENAIAPAPWTLAAHSTIFTGLLPHQHGADWAVPLNSGPWTLAEILESRGYETAGFNANDFYGQSGWGIAQGFEVYRDLSQSLRHNFGAMLAGRTLWEPFYQDFVRFDLVDRTDAHQLTTDVLRWYRRRSSRPYFLFVNYFDAHIPYQSRPPFDRHAGKAQDRLFRKVDYMVDHAKEGQKLPYDEQEALESAYDDCLEYLDGQVGSLIREIERSSGSSNNVFIITSDHGEAFGEHGRYSHGWDLHREEIHVPLIIFGAGIPNEVRVSHVVRTRDLFSTVLDVALSHAQPFSSGSLRRFWTPGFTPLPYDDAVVSELIPVGSTSPGLAQISLTTDDWHFIHHAHGFEELYRWRSDPMEQSDCSQMLENQAALDALRARLESMMRMSLEPWLGPGYLFALNRPDYNFLGQCRLSERMRTKLLSPPRRVGTSQAYFGLDSAVAPRPTPTDEELLRSLPYK